MLNYIQIVLIVIVFPCLSYAAADQITSDSATARGAEPKVLYQKYCSVCHGDNGNGNTRVVQGMDPKPRDFTSPETAMSLSRDRMILSISYGRPGTAMVAHGSKLSRLEIEGIVDYIREKFMRTPNQAKDATLEPSLVLGQKIYARHCSVCHGDKGNSSVWTQGGLNPPPRSFTETRAKSELSRQRMIQSVTAGRRGTAMMPFSPRLSIQEIEEVVKYIRSSFMGISAEEDSMMESQAKVESPQKAVSATQTQKQIQGVDMSSPMPFGLIGNKINGRDFFMHNCFTCHGVEGKGDGPRSTFIFPRPRNFTNDISRSAYNRPRLYTAIAAGKTGTVMPAWNKVLSRQQIADVAEFVFQTFIQAIPESSGSIPQKHNRRADLVEKKSR